MTTGVLTSVEAGKTWRSEANKKPTPARKTRNTQLAANRTAATMPTGKIQERFI
jgi:hypothetical protein